jgi:hypothetical protein
LVIWLIIIKDKQDKPNRLGNPIDTGKKSRYFGGKFIFIIFTGGEFWQEFILKNPERQIIP